MVDRGFLIEGMLNEKDVKIVWPPFLGGRHWFTSQEEAAIKYVAKHWIQCMPWWMINWKNEKIQTSKNNSTEASPVFAQCVPVCDRVFSELQNSVMWGDVKCSW